MVNRDKPCYLTLAGKRKLEQELEEIRTVRRPALAENIRQLNGFGGFSETEMDEFVNEQNQIDAHVKEIEYMLRHAIIIADGGGAGDKVGLGSHVTVRDGGGDEIHWTIVGSAEANTRQGKISNESPIGRALLGHKVGDVVDIRTPASILKAKVVSINGAG